MNKRITKKQARREPLPLSLRTATTKWLWSQVMIYNGAQFFRNVWGKPIEPAMKRWRRLRRLLIKELI